MQGNMNFQLPPHPTTQTQNKSKNQMNGTSSAVSKSKDRGVMIMSKKISGGGGLARDASGVSTTSGDGKQQQQSNDLNRSGSVKGQSSSSNNVRNNNMNSERRRSESKEERQSATDKEEMNQQFLRQTVQENQRSSRKEIDEDPESPIEGIGFERKETATFGQELQSPSKIQRSGKKKESESKIVRERLGVESISDIGEIMIQLQGYTGAAAATASTTDQTSIMKQQLKFKDLYHNPVIIGQGAYGLVIRVEKMAIGFSRNNPNGRPHQQSQLQTSSFTSAGAARNTSQLQQTQDRRSSLDSQDDLSPNNVTSNSLNLVAVKVINKRELNDAGYQILKNEALILREMDHPNIVKFYDIYETNEFIFIEMEYIPNGTLRQMMAPNSGGKKRFTDFEASQIIGGLLSAVEHVHSKNYVHRDLKPDNVLIGVPRIRSSDEVSYFKIDGRTPVKLEDVSELRQSIKLADFGLSTSFRIGQANSLDERMGTLLFMAPEQTKSQNYGKKIDIWAVGIIMFLLIEGRHPLYLSGVDSAQTYHEKLIRCNPSKWASEDGGGKYFSSMARDFFSKLCNPMPIERYTAEQALRHPWITRDFESPIPQTESQKVREVQAESILRNALNITFFLSVAKLRRNVNTLELKNSQKSTSSSSNSGGATTSQPLRHQQLTSQQFGGVNVQDYMAKCERVILETEETDRQKKEMLKKREQSAVTPIKGENQNQNDVKDEEIIDNFEETRSQESPQTVQNIKNAKKKLFDFNSQNLKKNEEQGKKMQQTSSTVPQSSLNSTSVKRVSTFKKQSANQSSVANSQPQVVKKANIHYQQLFADTTPQEDQNNGVLPGCIISGPQQLTIKRKSQITEDSQIGNGPKSFSPPVKRHSQLSQNGKRKQKLKSQNQTSNDVGASSSEENLKGLVGEVSPAFNRSPDTYRNAITEENSPNTQIVKRRQSGVNIVKQTKNTVNGGSKFTLNLHQIDRQDSNFHQNKFAIEGANQQIARINRTPFELERAENVETLIHNDLDPRSTLTNKPKRQSKSKNQKRRLVDGNQQNDLNIIHSSLEGNTGRRGLINLGRQSTTDIQKIMESQKSKASYTTTNPDAFQSDNSSLKKKRSLVGVNSIKTKQMADLNQMTDNMRLLDGLGGYNDPHNISFEQQNSLVKQTGGDLGNSYFMAEDRQLSLQQNKAQLKSALQSKLGKQQDPSQDFQLPMIVPPNNESITNRRLGPHPNGEEWSNLKNSALGVQKKPSNQVKGQRSLENSGQRTHNYFFNQQHSLIQNLQMGVNLLEGIDPKLQINQQHSFIQPGSGSLQSSQVQNTAMEARRQSTNFSAIEKQTAQLHQENHQTQFLNAQQQYNHTQLHPAVSNFDFMQFQQKYLQWKDQRSSLIAQKSGGGGGIDDPSRTVVKGSAKAMGLDYQIPSQYMVGEADDFLLMAAKGVPGLKQQRSTANVILNSGQNVPQRLTQNISTVEPNNESIMKELYSLSATKTPLQNKGSSIIEGPNAITGGLVQLYPHQIRLEDQLKALIAGNPNHQQPQAVKIGSKIPMHLKNVQAVKEANTLSSLVSANQSAMSSNNHSNTNSNQNKPSQMIEGSSIAPSALTIQSNQRNKKKTTGVTGVPAQPTNTNTESTSHLLFVGNQVGNPESTNQIASLSGGIISSGITVQTKVTPAKLQVVVQTSNNPKQLQIQQQKKSR